MMVERRYTDDELSLLANIASGKLVCWTGTDDKRLLADGLIIKGNLLHYEITDAGRRVIGEA